MANLKKLGFAIRILLRAGIAAVALTFAGCEEPLLYDASAAGYASMANNPQISTQQRNAAVLMSGLMSREGQRVHEMNVAEEGRSQITINNSPQSSITDAKEYGRQVLTFPNGDKYEGQVENGKFNGRGVYTWENGWKYDGEWKDNKRDGRGVSTSPDGWKYDGEWKDNKRDGRGVSTSPDGSKYDGEWKDDRESGRGVYTWGSLDMKHDGEWKEGEMNGQGRRTASDGMDVSGEWRDGKPWRTKGTDFMGRGLKYIGEWNHDGSKSGGTITWPDGRVYEGEWSVLESKPCLSDGQGTLTWPDGRKYTGDFREGKMHGLGKMTYPDGKVEEGAWRDDKFVGGGTVSPSGSSKTGFVSVSADDQTLEVYADGAFVGNTPAKLKLSEGTHVIEVKKAGYKDYKKEIKITEGCELNLRAVLEKE